MAAAIETGFQNQEEECKAAPFTSEVDELSNYY
jgi:hypothetical protein